MGDKMATPGGTAAKPKIGFIGLGIMGRPMAKNLLKAGYELVVYDIVPAGVDDVAKAGAQRAGSNKEVAQQSDVVITMLPDSPDVEAAMLGSSGVFEGLHSGLTLIDMSSISPVTARKVAAMAAEKGVEMLDAPVSGGDVGAINATLSIMVGGKQEVFERCRPIFEVLGKNINLVGESGAGQVCKAANQIVVALTIDAVAEALVFAQKAGVDPARVRQALMGGFAESRVPRGPRPADARPELRPRLPGPLPHQGPQHRPLDWPRVRRIAARDRDGDGDPQVARRDGPRQRRPLRDRSIHRVELGHRGPSRHAREVTRFPAPRS